MIETRGSQVRYLPEKPEGMSENKYGIYVAEHILLGDETWTDELFSVFSRIKRLEEDLVLDNNLPILDRNYLFEWKGAFKRAFPSTHEDVWAAFELVYESRKRSIETVTTED
jgi:hypothetical protein